MHRYVIEKTSKGVTKYYTFKGEEGRGDKIAIALMNKFKCMQRLRVTTYTPNGRIVFNIVREIW